MKFDLVRRVRRPSRKPIELPLIRATKVQADDLALIYLKVVAAWRGQMAAIVEAYDRTLGKMLRTDSVEETGGLIDDMVKEIERLVLRLSPELRRWAFQVERTHRGKWTRGVLAATDVDLTTTLGPEQVSETIEAVLQRNVSLVTDVSNEMRQRIADAVFRGFQQRTPAVEIARQIRESVSMGRARAIRIASDQTTKLSSALDAERQRQAGLDHWKWRSSHKLHYRPAHQARDGKIYTDETAPADLPGMLPFCGCTRQGIIVFDD